MIMRLNQNTRIGEIDNKKISGSMMKRKRRIIMRAPEERPVVKLIGSNGNAFAVMGKIKQALKKSGADKEYIDQYISEAMSGNYDNLLVVSMEYVDIQ